MTEISLLEKSNKTPTTAPSTATHTILKGPIGLSIIYLLFPHATSKEGEIVNSIYSAYGSLEATLSIYLCLHACLYVDNSYVNVFI